MAYKPLGGVMKLSIKRVAGLLGIETADIAEFDVEDSTDYCDTYRVKLARHVKALGARGDTVLFPVEKTLHAEHR